jgi:hypothetical protein
MLHVDLSSQKEKRKKEKKVIFEYEAHDVKMHPNKP